METEIRQLVCRALLSECFRLVRQDLRASVQALSGELSHRKSVIEDHKNRISTLAGSLEHLRKGKINFDKGQETDDHVAGLLDCVVQIEHDIRDRLIAPLEAMAQSAPMEDHNGCSTDLAFRSLIHSAPWKSALDMADGAYRTIDPARRRAVDQLRLLNEPRIHLENPARVFVASTSEGLEFTRALARRLAEIMPGQIDAVVWKDCPEFRQGASNLEALEKTILAYRIGIAVISPNDRFDHVRDDGTFPIGNVLLEHGMFIGKHSRFRAFMVQPRAGTPGLSDLKGIVTAEYDPSMAEEAKINAVSATIARAIRSELEP